MTNTKFRKRALLSSVAMLLVALVALGSATFAWFTSNPNADAKGLVLKATAAKGLVIITGSSLALINPTTDEPYVSKSNGTGVTGWLHEDFLNVKDSSRNATSSTAITLDAASSNRAASAQPSFFTVSAKDDDKFNADPNAEIKAATVGMSSGGVYHEEIWCKLLGTAASEADIKIKNITFTAGTTTKEIKEAIRMSLYYTDATGTTAAIAPVTTGTGKAGEFDFASARQTNKYLTATSAKYSDVSASLTNKTTEALPTNITIGKVDDSGNCKLDVYFWLDGEDDKCFTDNVDISDILSNVKIDLTVAD